MMHAPASGFRRATPKPTPPAVPPVASIAGPVTPAHYLRLRRVHAGLTIPQLADRITTDPAQRSIAIAMLRLLETPGAVAKHVGSIRVLARVMPFDASVYWQLAHDPVEAHPRICHGCGYTIWDAYSVEDQLLRWTTDTSCSRCTPDADAGQ